MKKNLKIIQSFAISAIFAMVFIVAATVTAELSAPFKDFLKSNFLHHWVGKGVIAALIFVAVGAVAYMLPAKADSKRTSFILYLVSLTTILGFLAILGFYIYEGLFA